MEMSAGSLLMELQPGEVHFMSQTFPSLTVRSHSGLQKNIDRISQTFGRAVIGIHNKT